jgi:hypothetical protein
MKSRSIAALVLPLLIAAAASPQTKPEGAVEPSAAAAIEGVWRAQADGLPFVTLNLTREEGNLSGAILFYLHRQDPGQTVTSTVGVPEPLVHPQLDGKTLTFAVNHRNAHPPASLKSPPVHFTVIVEGPGKAELFRDNDPSAKVEIVKDAD